MPNIIDVVQRGNDAYVYRDDGSTGVVQLFGRELFDWNEKAVLIREHYGVCIKNGHGETIGTISKIGIDSVKVSGRNIVVSEGVYRYTYDLDGNHIRTDTRL